VKKKSKSPSSRAPLAQFVAILALTVSIFLIVDFGRQAAANYRSQREAERLSQEVEAVQQVQAKLLAQRTYAASDLYVEEVARRELKWARPGETVYVVVPDFEPSSPLNASTHTTNSIKVTATTPQEAWWELFFGNQHPSHFLANVP